MVDGLERVESEIADGMKRLKAAEIEAVDARAALAPLLSRQIELQHGVAIGRVFSYNGRGTRWKPGPVPERAVLESITWHVPGQAVLPMPPKPTYKLRRINADGKLSKIVHEVHGLWQWDLTGETLDLRSAERA